MTTLFLTRKYPPSRGGMETFSYELFKRTEHNAIHIVAHQKNILCALLVLFFRALPHLRSIQVIHVGDAVLAPVAAMLHWLSKKAVVVTIHGLELTSNYGGRFYHALIRASLPSITHWVAVSQYTATLAKRYGIDSERISVIYHGAHRYEITSEERRLARERAISSLQPFSPSLPTATDPTALCLILSVGRLVQRKGIAWYIANVFPHLPQHTILCIISDGPEKNEIQTLIRSLNLTQRVFLLGTVAAETLHDWYAAADLFIFPNIPVPYDVEGFGLTALEAASHGAAVIVADMEGLTDAILAGQNGLRVQPLNAQEWITQSLLLVNNREARQMLAEQARNSTPTLYSWDRASEKYIDLFKTCSSDSV